MVRLEPITADNFEECISLTLTERQRFVWRAFAILPVK